MGARSSIVAGVLTIASCVGSASALVLSYEMRGTVEQISDSPGLLGPAPGATFTLTYVANFSTGAYGGVVGGFGGSNWLIGGTAFAPDPLYPTIQTSPVAAVLEINGKKLEFLGTSYGQVQYTQNWFDEQFGGHGSSWADFSAETRADSDGALLSLITSSLISTHDDETFGSIDTLGSIPVDGRSISGSTTFSYLWAAGTAEEGLISGRLITTSFSVTPAIPEPGNWTLLVAGLSGLCLLRRRRFTSA